MISVEPGLFEAQLSFLLESGWKAVSVHSILECLSGGSSPPENAFIITFDDAYDDIYEHALPVLQDLNAPACVYVITDFIGADDSWNHRADTFSRHLSWEQLLTMRSAGFAIGCHTKTHQSLVKLDDSRLHEEIMGAKACLEDGLGADVDLFCYPYGRVDTRVHAKVAAHFAHAYSVEDGSLDWRHDRWAARRIYIGPKHTPQSVAAQASAFKCAAELDFTPPRSLRTAIG